MQLLFVADPLAAFKIYKDTTFAMMREAALRGHEIVTCEPRHLSWQRGATVLARAAEIELTGHTDEHWYRVEREGMVALNDMDAVLMRKDPPFDSEYFYSTHLLEQAERDGARVFNWPRALRDHPEKLAILEFPQFIAPTLVTRDAAQIKRFLAEHRDIVLKPLDGMGGMGSSASAPTASTSARSSRPERRRHDHRDGAEVPAGDRRTATSACWSSAASRCRTAWRAFRRAARSAATSRPAARASRCRCRRATARSPPVSARCCAHAACCWSAWT